MQGGSNVGQAKAHDVRVFCVKFYVAMLSLLLKAYKSGRSSVLMIVPPNTSLAINFAILELSLHPYYDIDKVLYLACSSLLSLWSTHIGKF